MNEVFDFATQSWTLNLTKIAISLHCGKKLRHVVPNVGIFRPMTVGSIEVRRTLVIR
jgi:hypothetical protein